jgi:hypothetical protein
VEDDVGSLYEEKIGVMNRKRDRVNNPWFDGRSCG